MGGRGITGNRAFSSGDGGAGEASGTGGERDELTAANFNGDFEVTGYDAAAKAYMRQLFGRNISEQELGKMFGMPDGATFEVNYNPNTPRKNEFFEVQLEDHKWIQTMERYIYKDEHGEIAIKNSLFYMKQDANQNNLGPKGFGTRVFAQQVQQSRASGVNYIKTYASRLDYDPKENRSENGYYTWARLGYNAQLPDRFKARLLTMPQYRGVTTTNQLMARGGAALWKEHGSGTQSIFSLDRGSTSLRILNSYLRNRGIKTGRKTPSR
jgi:hypothetical protein